MADRFTLLLKKQLEKLFGKLQRGTIFYSAELNLDLPATEEEISLAPQQVIKIIQGDSELLEKFETQLERRFAELADKILNNWMENTDKEIRNSLRELAKLADILTSNDFTRNATNTGSFVGQPITNFANNVSGSNLRTTMASSIAGVIDSLLWRKKLEMAETNRSRLELVKFRESRGQLQARLAAEIAKGRRYI